jgi:hypothetical protein
VTTPGIFCIEGPWSADLRHRATVRPLLDVVEGMGRIRPIYQKAESPESLVKLVLKWQQKRYAAFRVGQTSVHGGPGVLTFGRRRLSLAQLAEAAPNAFKNKIVYFDSCSVLDMPLRDIRAFRKAMAARCLAGFTNDIDWYEASAFNLLFLDVFTRYKRLDAAERHIKRDYGSLQRKLGFRLYY